MNLQERYNKEIKPTILKELGVNAMQLPKMDKVVVNTGIGDFARDKKSVEQVAKSISLITGQKVLVTKARKSIASFKVREGMPVGLKVTLRGKRMYDFVEKLINIVLPRIRDFHGIAPSSLDQNGNLTIGIKDVSAFPEISKKDLVISFGLEVTLTVKSASKEHSKKLLEALGMPFRT